MLMQDPAGRVSRAGGSRSRHASGARAERGGAMDLPVEHLATFSAIVEEGSF